MKKAIIEVLPFDSTGFIVEVLEKDSQGDKLWHYPTQGCCTLEEAYAMAKQLYRIEGYLEGINDFIPIMQDGQCQNNVLETIQGLCQKYPGFEEYINLRKDDLDLK